MFTKDFRTLTKKRARVRPINEKAAARAVKGGIQINARNFRKE